ncbi:hypothetical protein CROQUDRAFT_98766 [Cronartium quercuum f. sp. fusiforme G11]|uniref:Uncharacterized protein n=1 Tax=Cronartium quercuum f. sp. fusiforme G11 TaxID=708437 RepID=A0A9P6NCD1_9BASI|nr:hypothetical protein CROQUDRAFT_98766 [Cronartium quercuum f. sp. fusiforme G11]
MHLKRIHWWRFLAMCTGPTTYKAFNYTKPSSSGKIAPLYHSDRSLTMEKREQADLLFRGTSIAHALVDLSEPFLTQDPTPSQTAPRIICEELEDIIKDLPKGKAKGPDKVPNELIQLAMDNKRIHQSALSPSN